MSQKKFEIVKAATEETIDDRLRKVLKKATDVLGDEKSARDWMQKRIPALDRQVPSDLVKTLVGYDLVMTILDRIEFGVYS